MHRVTTRAPIGWRSKHGRGTRWRLYNASRETAPCFVERSVNAAEAGELVAFAMEEDWDTELLEQEAASASQRRSEEQVWMASSGRPNSPSLRFSSRPSSPLSGFPGRPNSPFFGFSQNKGSLDANEGLNRSLHMQHDTGGYSGSRERLPVNLYLSRFLRPLKNN